MSLRKEKRRKKRMRGNGSTARELQAIKEAQRQEETGGKPQEKPRVQGIRAPVQQYFSPELAKLETPYFATNNVRYLGICGLCNSPITSRGKCMNPDCGQEWGNPRTLTDELVVKMIARAKEASSQQLKAAAS